MFWSCGAPRQFLWKTWKNLQTLVRRPLLHLLIDWSSLCLRLKDYQAGAHLQFQRHEVFSFPSKWDTSPPTGLSHCIKFTSTNLYMNVERHSERKLTCQGLSLDTWSGVKYTDHFVTVPQSAKHNPKIPCACQTSDTNNSFAWRKNQHFMYLLHKGGFKSNQHEKSEHAVVPVLVKTP